MPIDNINDPWRNEEETPPIQANPPPVQQQPRPVGRVEEARVDYVNRQTPLWMLEEAPKAVAQEPAAPVQPVQQQSVREAAEAAVADSGAPTAPAAPQTDDDYRRRLISDIESAPRFDETEASDYFSAQGMMSRDEGMAYAKERGDRIRAISEMFDFVKKHDGTFSLPGAKFDADKAWEKDFSDARFWRGGDAVAGSTLFDPQLEKRLRMWEERAQEKYEQAKQNLSLGETFYNGLIRGLQQTGNLLALTGNYIGMKAGAMSAKEYDEKAAQYAENERVSQLFNPSRVQTFAEAREEGLSAAPAYIASLVGEQLPILLTIAGTAYLTGGIGAAAAGGAARAGATQAAGRAAGATIARRAVLKRVGAEIGSIIASAAINQGDTLSTMSSQRTARGLTDDEYNDLLVLSTTAFKTLLDQFSPVRKAGAGMATRALGGEAAGKTVLSRWANRALAKGNLDLVASGRSVMRDVGLGAARVMKEFSYEALPELGQKWSDRVANYALYRSLLLDGEEGVRDALSNDLEEFMAGGIMGGALAAPGTAARVSAERKLISRADKFLGRFETKEAIDALGDKYKEILGNRKVANMDAATRVLLLQLANSDARMQLGNSLAKSDDGELKFRGGRAQAIAEAQSLELEKKLGSDGKAFLAAMRMRFDPVANMAAFRALPVETQNKYLAESGVNVENLNNNYERAKANPDENGQFAFDDGNYDTGEKSRISIQRLKDTDGSYYFRVSRSGDGVALPGDNAGEFHGPDALKEAANYAMELGAWAKWHTETADAPINAFLGSLVQSTGRQATLIRSAQDLLDAGFTREANPELFDDDAPNGISDKWQGFTAPDGRIALNRQAMTDPLTMALYLDHEAFHSKVIDFIKEKGGDVQAIVRKIQVPDAAEDPEQEMLWRIKATMFGVKFTKDTPLEQIKKQTTDVEETIAWGLMGNPEARLGLVHRLFDKVPGLGSWFGRYASGRWGVAPKTEEEIADMVYTLYSKIGDKDGSVTPLGENWRTPMRTDPLPEPSPAPAPEPEPSPEPSPATEPTPTPASAPEPKPEPKEPEPSKPQKPVEPTAPSSAPQLKNATKEEAAEAKAEKKRLGPAIDAINKKLKARDNAKPAAPAPAAQAQETEPAPASPAAPTPAPAPVAPEPAEPLTQDEINALPQNRTRTRKIKELVSRNEKAAGAIERLKSQLGDDPAKNADINERIENAQKVIADNERQIKNLEEANARAAKPQTAPAPAQTPTKAATEPQKPAPAKKEEVGGKRRIAPGPATVNSKSTTLTMESLGLNVTRRSGDGGRHADDQIKHPIKLTDGLTMGKIVRARNAMTDEQRDRFDAGMASLFDRNINELNAKEFSGIVDIYTRRNVEAEEEARAASEANAEANLRRGKTAQGSHKGGASGSHLQSAIATMRGREAALARGLNGTRKARAISEADSSAAQDIVDEIVNGANGNGEAKRAALGAAVADFLTGDRDRDQSETVREVALERLGKALKDAGGTMADVTGGPAREVSRVKPLTPEEAVAWRNTDRDADILSALAGREIPAAEMIAGGVGGEVASSVLGPAAADALLRYVEPVAADPEATQAVYDRRRAIQDRLEKTVFGQPLSAFTKITPEQRAAAEDHLSKVRAALAAVNPVIPLEPGKDAFRAFDNAEAAKRLKREKTGTTGNIADTARASNMMMASGESAAMAMLMLGDDRLYNGLVKAKKMLGGRVWSRIPHKDKLRIKRESGGWEFIPGEAGWVNDVDPIRFNRNNKNVVSIVRLANWSREIFDREFASKMQQYDPAIKDGTVTREEAVDGSLISARNAAAYAVGVRHPGVMRVVNDENWIDADLKRELDEGIRKAQQVIRSAYHTNIRLADAITGVEARALAATMPDFGKWTLALSPTIDGDVGTLGQVDEDAKTIWISATGLSQGPNQILATLVHEVGHIQQNVEGWAPGGNDVMFGSGFLRRTGVSGPDAYWRLSGEVMSRALETRSLMLTREQRLDSLLADEMDNEVKRKDRIDARTMYYTQTERGGKVRSYDIYDLPLDSTDLKRMRAMRSQKSVRPSGLQKQAGTVYPDAGAEISGLMMASVGSARRAEMTRLLKKHRPDLNPEEVVAELEKFDTTKEQKAALHWVIRGGLALPQDAYKVADALSVAEKAKVDPFRYKSPDELLLANKDFKPSARPIDPATVPELADARDEGDGIVSYLVQDDHDRGVFATGNAALDPNIVALILMSLRPNVPGSESDTTTGFSTRVQDIQNALRRAIDPDYKLFAGRVDLGEVMERAAARVRKDPGAVERLVGEALRAFADGNSKTSLSVSADDLALLRENVVARSQEMKRTAEEYAAAQTRGDRTEDMLKLKDAAISAEARWLDALHATAAAESALGTALGSIARAIRDDMSLGGMIRLAEQEIGSDSGLRRSGNTGRLRANEVEKLKGVANEAEAAEAEVEAAKKEDAEKKRTARVDGKIDESGKRVRSRKAKNGGKHETVAEAIKAVRELVEKDIAEGGGPIDITVYPELWARLNNGVKRIADAVIADHFKASLARMKQADFATALFNAVTAAIPTGSIVSSDPEHQELTQRDVVDLFADYADVQKLQDGYGKTDVQSGRFRAARARLRALSRLRSQLEDIRAVRQPLSAYERTKLANRNEAVDAEIEALQKEVDEAYRASGLSSDYMNRAMSPLDVERDRLERRRDELLRRIENKDFAPKSAKNAIVGAETLDGLRREVAEIEAELRAMQSDEKLSDEERVARMIARYRKRAAAADSRAEILRALKEKALVAKPLDMTSDGHSVLSRIPPELRAQLAEARRDAARASRDMAAARNNALERTYREERAMEIAIARREDLAERWEQALAAGKISINGKDPLADPKVKEHNPRLDAAERKMREVRAKRDRAIQEVIFDRRSVAGKVWQAVTIVPNYIRQMRASGDVSGIGIQCAVAVLANPIEGIKAVFPGVKAFWSQLFGSPEATEQTMAKIYADPDFPTIAEYVSIPQTDGNGGFTAESTEEFFRHSVVAERFQKKLGIPILDNRYMRASEAGFNVPVALIRFNLAKRLLAHLRAVKGENYVPRVSEMKLLGAVTNAATGRGKALAGGVKGLPDFSSVFWASGRVSGQVESLYLPVRLFLRNQNVDFAFRKKVAYELIGKPLFNFGLTMLMLAAARELFRDKDDDDPFLEIDPRSSKFLRAKVGKRYIDITGGLPQYVVLLAKGVVGTKLTVSGKEVPLRGGAMGQSWDGEFWRMIRNKLRPEFGNLIALANGRDSNGDVIESKWFGSGGRFNFLVRNSLLPLTFDDVKNAFEEDDEWGVATPAMFSALAILGYTSSNFGETHYSRDKARVDAVDSARKAVEDGKDGAAEVYEAILSDPNNDRYIKAVANPKAKQLSKRITELDGLIRNGEATKAKSGRIVSRRMLTDAEKDAAKVEMERLQEQYHDLVWPELKRTR